MSTPLRLRALQAVSIGGVLFAGYMSGIRLMTSGCAFDEPCPYVFGVPVCYVGFALFLALTLAAHGVVRGGIGAVRAYAAVRAIAAAGALFAGYYGLGELPGLVAHGFDAYVLGLPTCMLGALCFLLALLLSVPRLGGSAVSERHTVAP